MDLAREPREEIAEQFATYLRENLMPYWYDTTIDSKNGGYILSDTLDVLRGTGNPWCRLRSLFSTHSYRNARKAIEKQLVSQSRMLFVFSLTHRLGYSDARRGSR